ncbi:MAG: class C sortase [Ruminococcus sp.]|nr:class C sortase [Ruminococcus sp.]MBQ7027020.1 class C sortase [Ruminococcus sp.]
MNKKSSLITTIIFTIMLFVGLLVMLYPIISNWWNSRVQSRAIANYEMAVNDMDDGEAEAMIAEAVDYNSKIVRLESPFTNYEQVAGYYDILDISGTGIMGYISIPSIQVEIPIYHGTSKSVLNVAAGHLEGSTIPVGGPTTHSVISAHRGLPSAKLFTDLDRLVVGDIFTINVLGEVYTYEVEEIHIVLPHEMDKLLVVPGEDIVTLMTCTPYAVNTHRLLLRSHRIDTKYVSDAKVVSDATKVDPMLVVPILSAPMVLLLILYWVFGGKNKAPHETLRYMVYSTEYKSLDEEDDE